MNFIKTEIPEVIILEPKVFGDERGYFFESYNKKDFDLNIGTVDFIQDNESKSKKGVLRGLHFQKPPYSQAKLVRCVQGSVLDVVVDLRSGSSTFGKHISVELSGSNKKQLYIPKGFAHGFIVLSEEAVFAYKVDSPYMPEFESGIKWDDEDLNIDWIINKIDIQLSSRDKVFSTLKELKF